MNTDGNTDAINRHLAEREAYDEQQDMETELQDLRDEVDDLTAKLAEMTRRRDAWRAKAEGYDEVRLALREKVGTPWPPYLSRLLWAGIAADEKKRADDAEAKLAEITAERDAIAARLENALNIGAENRTRADLPAPDPMDDPRVKVLVEAFKNSRLQYHTQSCAKGEIPSTQIKILVNIEMRSLDAALTAMEPDSESP